MSTENKIKEEIKSAKSEIKNPEPNRDHIEKELSIISDALESTINGVIITDLEGRINYVNPAFIKMFEYNDISDVTGRLAHNLFVAKEVKTFSDVEALIERQPGETEEFLAHRMDDSKFWVAVSSTTVTGKDNRVVGRMASFVDITNRKLIEEENKWLTSELLKSHEYERQRFAQDLHDGVAQTIHAAKLNFVAYQKNVDKFKDRFKVGIEFLDKASQELREVSNDLYPSILRDLGLESTIRWYVRHYLEINNIKCRINIKIGKSLPAELEVNLYRITKEVFSNIIKHAQARTVYFELLVKKKKLFLRVEDNGLGYDSDEVKTRQGGFGLLNIQHRVKDLGGSIEIETTPNNGTIIKIKIGI